MYEKGADLTIWDFGSPSPINKNLASFHLDFKDNTFIAVAVQDKIHVFVTDCSLLTLAMETIMVDPEDETARITQIGIVRPSTRIWPYLVATTTNGIQIFDLIFIGNFKLSVVAVLPRDKMPKLASSDVKESKFGSTRSDWYQFYRGITCVDTTIYIGNHHGQILPFYCSSETSVSVKKPIHEHTGPILDMATCRYDKISASIDGNCELIIWAKNMKSYHNRIKLLETPTVVDILRKHAIVGTVSGLMFFYHITTGQIRAQVDMFKRPITCIHTAPESAYFLAADEGGYLNVFKLHTRKPAPYQVEHRYSDVFPNSMIYGAQYLNGRGNILAIACYDDNRIKVYKIGKKTESTEKNGSTK